ncbi:MAG: ribonuclease P protein component [Pseudomonadota bacterium]
MKRLKKRADFLRLAKVEAVRMPGFVLQVLNSSSDDEARVGFTVTKRQGNAVMRNRIRRRLREAVRLSDKETPFGAADYVVIGRKESLQMPFATLQASMAKAAAKAQNRLN